MRKWKNGIWPKDNYSQQRLKFLRPWSTPRQVPKALTFAKRNVLVAPALAGKRDNASKEAEIGSATAFRVTLGPTVSTGQTRQTVPEVTLATKECANTCTIFAGQTANAFPRRKLQRVSDASKVKEGEKPEPTLSRSCWINQFRTMT